MYLANVNAAAPPQPGDPLFGADPGSQQSGTIVSAAAAADGGYDVLAVLPGTGVEAGGAAGHRRRSRR